MKFNNHAIFISHLYNVCLLLKVDVLPMDISPFGVKEEIELEVPKQGLYKVCIGMYTL